MTETMFHEGSMLLKAKLHPSRFTAMSPKMAAIVGYIINMPLASPEIVELAITSDSFVLARLEGDCGYNDFIGHVSDFVRNCENLLIAAELTPTEIAEWRSLYCTRVIDWRT